MESQTNYEHAEDVVLKREFLVNGKARPKPKPKPRRKTLPGQVVLNADECLAKKVEIPLSNGISKHNSISSDIRSSVIPSNTVFKNSEEQGISKSNEKVNRKEPCRLLVETRVGLNLNFEFESAHELLMNLNLNSTFPKSMNLNFDFSKSMNLNLVFSQSMNLNLKIKNKMDGSNQCRR